MDIITQAQVIITEPQTKEAIEKHLDDLRLSRLHPTSISKYEHNIRAYELWLSGREISEHTAKQFIDYLKQQGFGEKTQQGYYHAIRPLLRGLRIPFDLPFNKEHKLPHFHNPDQVTAILNIIRSRKDRWSFLAKRDELIVLTLAYTGIRRAELINIRLRDIDFYNHILKVTGKGSRDRAIFISDNLYNSLREYTKKMNTLDRLFPMNPRRLNTIIKRYSMMAGITDMHPHSFRHYAATQLMLNGVDIEDVRVILGHSNISTTGIYLSTTASHQKEAIARLPKL